MYRTLARLWTRTLRSGLGRNVISGALTTVISGVLMMVSYRVFLGHLGYERYGAWLILSTVIVVGQLGNLGVSAALTKLVAEDFGTGSRERIRSHVLAGTGMLAATALLIFLLGLGFREGIVSLAGAGPKHSRQLVALMPYVAALSGYVFFTQASLGVLAGVGRLDLVNLISTATRVVSLGVSVALLQLGQGIEALLWGAAVSALVGHMAALSLTKMIAGETFLKAHLPDRASLSRVLGFGTKVLGGTLLNLLLMPAHKFLLVRFAGLAAVPVYEIAFTGAMQVRGLFDAGVRALMPEASRLSKMPGADMRPRLGILYRKSVLAVMIVGLPSYLLLFALCPVLLKVWLGVRFVPEIIPSFRTMLAASFVSLVSVPAYHMLTGMGEVGKSLIVHALQTLVSLAFVGVLAFWFRALSVNLIAGSVLAGFSVAALYCLAAYRTASARLSHVRAEKPAAAATL